MGGGGGGEERGVNRVDTLVRGRDAGLHKQAGGRAGRRAGRQGGGQAGREAGRQAGRRRAHSCPPGHRSCTLCTLPPPTLCCLAPTHPYCNRRRGRQRGGSEPAAGAAPPVPAPRCTARPLLCLRRSRRRTARLQQSQRCLRRRRPLAAQLPCRRPAEVHLPPDSIGAWPARWPSAVAGPAGQRWLGCLHAACPTAGSPGGEVGAQAVSTPPHLPPAAGCIRPSAGGQHAAAPTPCCRLHPPEQRAGSMRRSHPPPCRLCRCCRCCGCCALASLVGGPGQRAQHVPCRRGPRILRRRLPVPNA